LGKNQPLAIRRRGWKGTCKVWYVFS
jgi:hypothetical protein